MPRSTTLDIPRRQLRLFPFKTQLWQSLQHGDKAKRMSFCRWLLDKWGRPCLRQHLFVSDEAHFYLNECVNKQNCRVWGKENLHALVEQDQYSQHVTVWGGLIPRGIIDPFYFRSRGRAVSVTEARYRRMLDTFLIFRSRDRALGDPLAPGMVSAGRGTTSHSTWGIGPSLRSLPEKGISKGGPAPWPPRSRDLSTLDCFLWDQLKGFIYAQPPPSLRALRARLSGVIATPAGPPRRSPSGSP